MTTDVQRLVAQHVPSRADSLVERLAERVGLHAGAAAVYGTPVERDGVTVIPVAKVRYGFGGGGGSGARGEGGGGGVAMTPVGYVEIRGGTAEFRPIPDPAAFVLAFVPVIVAGGLAVMLTLRGLCRLFRS
jgi:uncharacterized spore protein YtfJ